MRSGPHTSLIGEQTALGTLSDGFLQGHTKGTADDSLRLESILEDQAEGSGNVLDPGHQHDGAAQQEGEEDMQDKSCAVQYHIKPQQPYQNK